MKKTDKYQVKLYFEDGETELSDEEFDSVSEAEDYAYEMISNYRLGGEILNMSNPGDYPYNEKVRYRVIKSRM